VVKGFNPMQQVKDLQDKMAKMQEELAGRTIEASAGGGMVSVVVNGRQEVLSFPGFHQIFLYGDYKEQVRDFCQLCGFKAQVV